MSANNKKIRLATFNVNSVRTRLPILERWLPTSGVDVLLLQETKARDVDFPEEFFTSLGYDASFCGEKSYNGVAAIIKKDLICGDGDNVIAEVTFGFNDGGSLCADCENKSECESKGKMPPNFETRVCLVRLRIGSLKFKNDESKSESESEGAGHEIVILNTYVPQGKMITHRDFEVKKKFFTRVRRVIDREIKNHFVWTGDLNVAPTDIDVIHPENKRDHVCCCEEIRSCFAATSNGLTDMLRAFHPEPGQFTFFDYRLKDALTRNVGWRIDHFLASPSLATLAIDCFVDRAPRGWERPSDHTPLLLDIAL